MYSQLNSHAEGEIICAGVQSAESCPQNKGSYCMRESHLCEHFLWAQNKSQEILHRSDNSLVLLLAVIEELAGSHLCHLTKIFSDLKGKVILLPSSFRTMWML